MAETQAIERVTPQQKLLKQELEKIQAAMTAVLPRHVTAARITKVVLSATSRTPALLDCTVQSICRAVMQASELGLEIGGLLGEAYLVPYWNKHSKAQEAQCIIGYQGLIKLARNTGQLMTISARVVYAGEKFRVNLADDEIEHDLDYTSSERSDDDVIAAYAIGRLKDGGKQIEVMTRRELDAIRSRSKAGNGGPWVTDRAEMYRKTVVRRLCKYLPKSPELTSALEHDMETDVRHNAMGDLEVSAVIDPGMVTPQTDSDKMSAFGERINAAATPAELNTINAEIVKAKLGAPFLAVLKDAYRNRVDILKSASDAKPASSGDVMNQTTAVGDDTVFP